MTKAISIIRSQAIAGRHLNHCFADASVRQRGWKMMMDARRWARRLSYSLMALGVDL